MKFSRLLLLGCALILSWNVQAQFPCFSGQISVVAGYETSFCDDGNTPYEVRFSGKPAALPHAFLVVNSANEIVHIGYQNTINLAGLGNGLRVYSFSLIGSITAEIGDILNDTELASGCYSLSANFITIDNNGGQEGGTLEGGPFSFCVGDGAADHIDEGAIALTGNSGSNSQWVVTFPDGTIAGLPPSYEAVNFDGAGQGVCSVWHLSYEDGLLGLEAGMPLADISGCYSLSNPIEVNRYQPEGGTLEGGPFSFCVGDGVADHIDEGAIALTGNSGSNSQWVVTFPDGTIAGLPPYYEAVNFDGAGQGVCSVWHLSYEDGLLGLEAGMPLADISGCFSLSNPIEVVRTAVNGGMVTTTDGETIVNVTVGDGEDDIVPFISTAAIGDNFTFIITDESNNILAIPDGDSANFEGAGAGVCRVWGAAYSGTLTAEVDDNIDEVAISDGCFNVSDVFLTINRTEGFQTTVPQSNQAVIEPTILNIQLFPNPTANQLQVEWRTKQFDTLRNVEVMIVQPGGAVVYRNTFAAEQLRTSVDVSNLTAGTYFLSVNDGKQLITKRFIKS